MQRYDEVPSTFVNFLLPAIWCVISSTVGVCNDLFWWLCWHLLDPNRLSACHLPSRSRRVRVPSLWAPPLGWWFLVPGTHLVFSHQWPHCNWALLWCMYDGVLYHCVRWCDMFLGNGQFLQIFLDMSWWGLLLCWRVVSWGVENLDWHFYLLWWASSAAPTFSSGGWLHSWAPQCQVWHMMGVLGLLVPVCLLCNIWSVDSLQHLFLWESSLLLYPVFWTEVFWIRCKLSGMLWMTSVLLVNHQCWYIWGTAWWMRTVAWHYHLHQCQPCTWGVASLFSPISAGIWTVAKASVVESIWTSDNSIVLGSVLLLICLAVSHSLWNGVCRTTATTPTSSQWGSSSVPTSLTFLCFPPLLWCLGPLSLGPFCSLQHLGFQCPNFPHPRQWSSLAGHDDLPGGWDFVQCPHECTLSAWGFSLGEVCFASVWHLLFSAPSIPWPRGCLRWQCACGTLQASWMLLLSDLGLAASWLVPCHLGLLRICTGCSVPFCLLSGNCINQQELGDGQQVHLVTLQIRCEHLPVGRFCSIVILHGPSLMTGSPWRLKLAFSSLQSHQLCQLASNSQTSCSQCCPGNWAHTPVEWSWVLRWDPLLSPLEYSEG